MNSTTSVSMQAEAPHLVPSRRDTTRKARVEGDIAYVPLTQGYEAIIDASDVSLVEGFNWYAHANRNAVYAVRMDNTGPKPRLVRMHRVILGDPEGMVVDHQDTNGLNNRRANLRSATIKENACNQGIAKHNTSGHKGVSFHKRDGKWIAHIRYDGGQRYLGSFATPEAAAAAYAKANAEMHGAFGRTV